MLGVEVQESEFEESGEEDATAIKSHTHTPWTNTSILVYNVILGRIGCRAISKIYAYFVRRYLQSKNGAKIDKRIVRKSWRISRVRNQVS